MTESEGYIKFEAHWNNEPFFIDPALIEEVNLVRSELISKGWMGILPNGIGFGNISVRKNSSDHFIITGSATGGIQYLEARHFSLIGKYGIAENQLWCAGETIASSESLTHAAVYSSNPGIDAVIHIHSNKLWEEYLNKLPTSDQKAAYGTPEIAYSIAELFVQTRKNSGVFIMGGHADGLIAFGQNIKQVFEILMQL